MQAINTLAHTFKLAHHNVLKLKKYEGFVCNKEQQIEQINHIVDLSQDIDGTENIKELSIKEY